MANEEKAKYKIFEQAETPDEKFSQSQVNIFVDNFVKKDSRERWREFLIKKPKQLFKKSHKLYDCLDKTFYSILKDKDSFCKQNKKGIFYDFYDEPKILSIEQAFVLGYGTDALYIFEDGQKALYFFHEYEILFCTK